MKAFESLSFTKKIYFLSSSLFALPSIFSFNLA